MRGDVGVVRVLPCALAPNSQSRRVAGLLLATCMKTGRVQEHQDVHSMIGVSAPCLAVSPLFSTAAASAMSTMCRLVPPGRSCSSYSTRQTRAWRSFPIKPSAITWVAGVFMRVWRAGACWPHLPDLVASSLLSRHPSFGSAMLSSSGYCGIAPQRLAPSWPLLRVNSAASPNP